MQSVTEEFIVPVIMTTNGDRIIITLQHGVNAEDKLYRLKQGTVLRLTPASNLLGRNVSVYCNYPITDGAEFIRDQYHLLNWHDKNGKKLTDGEHPFTIITDLETHCEIEMIRSGTFHFYFVYQDE